MQFTSLKRTGAALLGLSLLLLGCADQGFEGPDAGLDKGNGGKKDTKVVWPDKM